MCVCMHARVLDVVLCVSVAACLFFVCVCVLCCVRVCVCWCSSVRRVYFRMCVLVVFFDRVLCSCLSLVLGVQYSHVLEFACVTICVRSSV